MKLQQTRHATEEHGIPANFEKLAKEFISKKEQDNGLLEQIAQDAKSSRMSPLKALVDNKRRYINFQNYDQCAKAFNKCYEIKFYEDLDVPTETLGELRLIIDKRHDIIHKSPLIDEGPFFRNKEYAKHAIDILDGFIQKLHNAKLKRNPT